ncbi:MAG: YbaN family protein [Bacillota bacterium]|jgi:uncharacterized membrane protein YbaN (DUF454 family)
MILKNRVLNIIGSIFVVLGLIGIFLPLLPTTPFVLLAVLCFVKSGSPLAHKLKKNKYLGPYIENYLKKTGVPYHIKIKALIFLWASMIISMLIVREPIIIIILIVIAIAVTIHIAKLKTNKP